MKNLHRFVDKNDAIRNTVHNAPSVSELTAAERERRKLAANVARLRPEDIHPAEPTAPQVYDKDPRPTNLGDNVVLQSRPWPQVSNQPGAFDDTDVEAADETVSSFTDSAPQRPQRYVRTQVFGQESEYGADEDEEYEEGQRYEDDDNLNHDLAMKHQFADIGMDDEGDTQPVQADDLDAQVANVVQNHGRIMGKGKLGQSERSRRANTPQVQQAQTPRRYQDRQKSRTTIEMPLRSGSVPAEHRSEGISPIEAGFRHQPKTTTSEKQHAGVIVPNSPQPKTTMSSKANMLHRQPFRQTATAPANVTMPQSKTSHAAKASESTLDQTSGYTSESSEARKKSSSRKHPRIEEELDYDLPTLTAMSFQELNTQSFDIDPRAPAISNIGPSVQSFQNDQPPPADTTEAKISHLLSTLSTPSPSTNSDVDLTAATSFFSTLPLAEWEEAGDDLLSRFSDLLAKTKAARQERRNVATRFEMEIQKRYEDVEEKRVGLDRTMQSMRGGAQGVLMRGGGLTPRK